MKRRPKAVYVAYRRPDLDSVDRLVAALEEELGPPPDWSDGWFFVDRSLDGGGVDAGSVWLHTLTEAHRNAACVIGVMSANTMPATEGDVLRHAIYIDELRRAQIWGRLKPVVLGTEPFQGLLGFDVSQSVFWTGIETPAVHALANTVRDAVRRRVPEGQETLARRSRWLTARRQTPVADQAIMIGGTDLPLILRHVVDAGINCFVSASPISFNGMYTLDKTTVALVIENAAQSGLPLRLLWVDEVLDILLPPPQAPADWRNPFDLALDLNGPPLWALDEAHETVTTISPRGTRNEDLVRATLWLTLND